MYLKYFGIGCFKGMFQIPIILESILVRRYRVDIILNEVYVMKQFKQVTELNKGSHPSTGQITCYAGKSPWHTRDDLYYVEVQDCHHKVRLHRCDIDSKKDFIKKLKKMRDALNSFIAFLEK